MVSDINTGSAGSNPSYLYPYNDKLFFMADDGIVGLELWAYDPTTGVTALVKDMTVGSTSSYYIYNQTVYNNVVYFMMGTNQLWKTDGTTAGTELVKNGLTLDYNNTKMVNYSGKLYFGSNYLLWNSDGTSVGTVALTTIPNPNFTNIQPKFELNEKLIILTENGTFGAISGAFWFLDSSQNVTTIDATGISSYGDLFKFNNAIYFEAFDAVALPGLYRFGIPLNLATTSFNAIDFSIFPNPTSDNITIQSKNQIFENASITLTNTIGQTVFKKENLNSDTINLDISSQTNGIYFLTVENQGTKTV